MTHTSRHVVPKGHFPAPVELPQIMYCPECSAITQLELFLTQSVHVALVSAGSPLSLKSIMHIWVRNPRYSWSPSKANMASPKRVRMMTSLRFLTEYMMALTMVLRPGITATDLRARKTLNVLMAEKLPRSTAIVTYDNMITEKSSQFQPSRRYVKLSIKRPRDTSLTMAS